MFMTCGARAPSNQLAGWGAAHHHRGAGHEPRIIMINPTSGNLRQVRDRIFLFEALLLTSSRMCGLLVT